MRERDNKQAAGNNVVQPQTDGNGKKQKQMKYAMAMVVVLLIEIFLWNHSFWLSLGNEPIVIDKIYMRKGELLTFDSDYSITPGFYLEIKDINQEVKNIYLNIKTNKTEQNDTLKIRFRMADAGSKAYYYVTPRVISSRLQKLNYISVYPYGNLRSLKIDFPGEYTTINVTDVVLNPRVPMFFSVWRVVLMYLVYLLGTALFFRPYHSYYEPGSKMQRRAAVGLCLLSVAVILPLTLKGHDANGSATMNKYRDLTHALAKGMVSLDIDVDERMLEAENPYDTAELAELGLEGYMWDYAYFEGKIYVYFGVVPVALTYLPCYLLTGRNLPHIIAYLFFMMLLIAGAFLLADAMIKRYCKKLPIKLYYLFMVTFMLGIGTLVFAKRVCIYNMAIMTAVCFTVWGLYFWISSVKDAGGQCVLWKVLPGSVCMALVAGCRPQLLMGSFLAFPIFGEKLKQMFADFKNKKWNAGHVVFLAAFGIPFIVIAALLMWYNYARFGSPFDFGAVYTLTTNDMRYRGIHGARMVYGLWSFLFDLPAVNAEFPFLRTTWINTLYQGIITQEGRIGGIFATNIILWPCFLIYHYRAKLREKKTLSFVMINVIGGMVIACADVQMAGCITRYMMDCTVFFYLASFMVILSFIDEYYRKQALCSGGFSEDVWCKVLALLCCGTILYCFMTILALYVSGDYDIYQSVWYYHLKEIFGVFDI